MRVFTFSGIQGGFDGTNDGSSLKLFARDVLQNLNPAPAYDGVDDQDHFRSDLNFSTILSTFEAAVTLNGSPTLNAEAEQKSPAFAQAIATALSVISPEEDVLCIAHSQGCNNLVHTLLRLDAETPALFENRKWRCLLLDPKVGANQVYRLFVLYPEKADLRFLFMQSSDDLLGNQAVFAAKFIDEFSFGDHLWIRGLNHATIRDWTSYGAAQSIVTRPGYLQFKSDTRKERLRLEQDFGRPFLNTVYMEKWRQFQAKYPMPQIVLAPVLLKYCATGELAKKYQS